VAILPPHSLLIAALPAAVLCGAALVQTLGIAHPLDGFPTPAAAPDRLERLVLLVAFLILTVCGPLAAFVLGLLAVIDGELRVEHWEINSVGRSSGSGDCTVYSCGPAVRSDVGPTSRGLRFRRRLPAALVVEPGCSRRSSKAGAE
jgi:hypothetical protein